MFELFRGYVLRPKRLLHRFVRFALARRRKAFQGVPLDSHLITLRARRSISGAQAASTSAFLRTGLKALQKFDGDARSVVWCQLQGLVEHFSYLGHVLNFTTVAAGA